MNVAAVGVVAAGAVAFAHAPPHHRDLLDAVSRYGYVGVAGILCAQDLGLPTIVPGAVVLIFAGYLASVGMLNPVAAGLVATLGCVAGASTVFGLARLGGEAFFRLFGRMLHVTPEQHARLEAFLRRWGLLAWLGIRFLPGLRAATSVVTGFGGMRYREFGLLTVAASLIWSYTFILVGMLLGRNWRAASGVVVRAGPIALAAVVVVLAAVVAVHMYRTRAPRKSD
ncbi:MAG TPA: DedA family protein [Ktedonobacterales bacterium]|jgi:membrane protein DedA with SNARE-associated domain